MYGQLSERRSEELRCDSDGHDEHMYTDNCEHHSSSPSSSSIMPRKAGPARPLGNCLRPPARVSEASSFGSGELCPAGERFAFPRPALPLTFPTAKLPIVGGLRFPVVDPPPVRAGALRGGGVRGVSACANVVIVLLADEGICPSPPTYAGLSSSSSTQSDSSPKLSDCRPENTSRMPGTSGG